jgi:hypothetical protein
MLHLNCGFIHSLRQFRPMLFDVVIFCMLVAGFSAYLRFASNVELGSAITMSVVAVTGLALVMAVVIYGTQFF